MNDASSTTAKLRKSILTASSLTPSSLEVKMKKKYTLKEFDVLVDKSLWKHPLAISVLAVVLCNARTLSRQPKMIQSLLYLKDLEIIEKNFLPVAAATSALHANPSCTVMFVDDKTFVLFNRKRPVGRYGKPLGKKTITQLFAECRKECGNIPGQEKAILDVLDAEGKSKDKQLKELFNDLSKHIITHSSGIAARSAKKLKSAAGIDGRVDWSIFKKSLDDASKRVKDLGYDPMVPKMEKTVKELHAGRNVLSIGRMNWMKIFETKDFDWLGRLSADILEDEVNRKPPAIDALSSVANWAENNINCSLVINYVGSEGVRISFTPAKKIDINKWKLELQDITKSGAKWKRR